jgi:hypothetical protein
VQSEELSRGPKQMEITLFNLDTGKVEEDDYEVEKEEEVCSEKTTYMFMPRIEYLNMNFTCISFQNVA